MAVAVDLEGTLTTGESWKALARYLREAGKASQYRQFFLRHFPMALAARLRLINKRQFQNRWMEDMMLLFAGIPEEAFADIAEWVVEHELWPKRREDILAALKVHQAAGEKIILSSGAYQPILDAFARRLNADAIGTPLEIKQGRLTGQVGSMNVRDTKAQRLHNYLGREQLYAAYGDTEADIPMLMLSDRPVAVYPDKALRNTAHTLGWSILEH